MTLDDMDLMLEQIASSAKAGYDALARKPDEASQMARIKLLALASHCVSAKRLVEDLRVAGVSVLDPNGEEPS